MLLVAVVVLLQLVIVIGQEAKVTEANQLVQLVSELVKFRERFEPVVSFVEQESDGSPRFDNEWAVKIVGGEAEARKVAASLGYRFVGSVRGIEDVYVFKLDKLGRRKREAVEKTKRLSDSEKVLWVEQQRLKRRQKRDLRMFNDPMWPMQWQLHDTEHHTRSPRTDMNVVEAWKMGATGKGVVVTILDDGIEHTHEDLRANYDPAASYDLNDNDADPMPTRDELNKHGTRCAGEVAMAANNSKCGVGVAYEASIGGVRMLDGMITDRIEAEALSLNLQHIDIFSSSWGPNDDGKTVEGPGVLAQSAILKGISTGRGGKGTIYVWASGNGGLYDDDCDCDGYNDSIYTFTVSSAAEDGSSPWYGEKCAATMTSTYSTGSNRARMIATTDLNNQCTNEHSGTSASAPLAAGIIALALQVNPKLTWRDVQHLAVWTSEPRPLFVTNEGWHQNGAGLWVNSRFGFGLMNAAAMVAAARRWTPVPRQRVCATQFPNFHKQFFNTSSTAVVRFRTDGCSGQPNEIRFLEHIQLVIDIAHTSRGQLSIYLTSPMKTKTQLLSVRRQDRSAAGFRHWPFMSVHTWGEDPKGDWQLEVVDKSGSPFSRGFVNNITLIAYGTYEQPEHYTQPRVYDVNAVNRGTRDRKVEEQRKQWTDRGRGILLNVNASLQRVERVIRMLDGIDDEQRMRRHSDPTYVLEEFLSK